MNQLKVYIFGAGKIADYIIDRLNACCTILGVIDNDENKWGKDFHGFIVKDPNEAIEKASTNSNIYMVITSSSDNRPYIYKQLTELGVSATRIFYYSFFLNQFLPKFLFENEGRIYVNVAQICVTERCTLSCKKCAHGCNYVKKKDYNKDMTLEYIKQSADSFFRLVDKCGNFVLIGGEPFLHKELAEAVDYIGQKYGEKIDLFSITTNGTVLPDEKLISAMQRNNIVLQISNYTKAIPQLRNQYDKLEKLLKKHSVKYDLSPAESEWTDYGFDKTDRGFFDDPQKRSDNELKEVFKKCKTECREIRGSKYYFCVMARSIYDNMKGIRNFECQNEDYLDLNLLKNDHEGKKIFIEYQIGNISKGYLDMCNYCNGIEKVLYPIPAGEQVLNT